jgi:glycosyltransferase involved in cell wall biosynthesis
MPVPERPPLWLADWSDSEDADFRAAWTATGIEARVLRTRPLGPTVGTGLHRLRSYPAYLGLAVRGLRASGGAPLVAWQPLAGALSGLLRRRGRPRLVVLNPLLAERSRSPRQRLALAGLRRADRILFFTRSGVEAATRLGLDPGRLGFVALGVRARGARPPGDYVVAAGREERDWGLLARAADGLDTEIRVVGPPSVPPPLRLLRERLDREAFLDLLAGARAVVVPLPRADRTAGQLTVLDAMAAGRAVVATRAQGTEDYVTPETGILVPPGDADALREALRRVCEPGVAERMGEAARAAAQGAFSLERFVREVDAEARRG